MIGDEDTGIIPEVVHQAGNIDLVFLDAGTKRTIDVQNRQLREINWLMRHCQLTLIWGRQPPLTESSRTRSWGWVKWLIRRSRK